MQGYYNIDRTSVVSERLLSSSQSYNEVLEMKTSHAAILVIVCITMVIIGWNGLMNTTKASSVAISTEYKDSNEIIKENYKLMQEQYEGKIPGNSNSKTIPIAMLFSGIVGFGFGIHTITENMRPHRKPTKISGG